MRGWVVKTKDLDEKLTEANTELEQYHAVARTTCAGLCAGERRRGVEADDRLAAEVTEWATTVEERRVSHPDHGTAPRRQNLVRARDVAFNKSHAPLTAVEDAYRADIEALERMHAMAKEKSRNGAGELDHTWRRAVEDEKQALVKSQNKANSYLTGHLEESWEGIFRRFETDESEGGHAHKSRIANVHTDYEQGTVKCLMETMLDEVELRTESQAAATAAIARFESANRVWPVTLEAAKDADLAKRAEPDKAKTELNTYATEKRDTMQQKGEEMVGMLEAINSALFQDISALAEFIEAAEQKGGNRRSMRMSNRNEGVAKAAFAPKGLTSKDGQADGAAAASSAAMKLMMKKGGKKKSPFG